MNTKVITRFSPSPTGFMHIGGLRTALYNYIYAKKNGGDFLLRIEDTDTARTINGAKEYILNALEWLGIKNDGEIIVQSERNEIYKKYALELIRYGHAYYAFDTKEELDTLRGTDPQKPIPYSAYTRHKMRNSLTMSETEVNELINNGTPYVIRFKVEKNKDISFVDTIRGHVSFNSNNVDDKVLLKSDGGATYFLANTVDDALSGVTHVIKGQEWLPSSPIIIMLYEALRFPVPTFCHLSLVLDDTGKKISKRNHKKYDYPIFPLTGEYTDEKGVLFSVKGLKDSGYEPEAVINALVLVGWTPKGETDVLTLDKIIEQFDLKDLHKADAIFPSGKLKFLNKEYLKEKSLDYLLSFIETNGMYAHDFERLRLIADIALERSHFNHELNSAVDYFFNDVNYINTKPKNVDEFINFSEHFLGLISGNVVFTSKEQVTSIFDFACISANVAKGKVLPDLRNALCGGKSGAELTITAMILGRNETEKRIKNFIKHIKPEEHKVSAWLSEDEFRRNLGLED